MRVAAQNSFTAPAFATSVRKHGDKAKTIERVRLAGAEQAEMAEHEFATFFGIESR